MKTTMKPVHIRNLCHRIQRPQQQRQAYESFAVVSVVSGVTWHMKHTWAAFTISKLDTLNPQ